MKRELYVVGPAGASAPKPWKLTREGVLLGYYGTQQDAEATARMIARNRLKLLGRLAELQIRGKDGKIHEKDTYGDDPGEIPG